MTDPGPPRSGAPGAAGDAASLRALAEAIAAADPVPDRWRRAAEVAGDWLAVDAERAELTHDSVDDVRPAGTAPGSGVERRHLRYDGGGVTVDVELRVAAGALRVAGRVVPAGPCPVRVLQPCGTRATDANDAGSFQFDELPRSPVSLVVERDPAVKTGWIVP